MYPTCRFSSPKTNSFLSSSRNKKTRYSLGVKEWVARTAPLSTGQPLELPGLSVALSPTQRGQISLPSFFPGTDPGSKRFTKPTCLVMWG